MNFFSYGCKAGLPLKVNLRLMAVVAAACVTSGSAVIAAEHDAQTLQKENAELRQRLDSVEKELSEIKKLLTPTPAAAPGTASTPAPITAFTPAETEKLKALAGMKGKPARSSLDLNFYGYVKLDVAYDDSRVSVGNFGRWVETESVLKDDKHFDLTANQTRLGVDITGPSSDRLQSSGKVEIDFYGAGTGENKPEPMLRHAFVRVDWPEYKFGILAGQTSDIISPLSPNTVNYSVAWWQGNVGYRRPQLRFIKSFALDENVELKFDGGISRTITGRKYVFKESSDPDTGADAGFPTVVGRAGLSFPVWGKRQATAGFSGHYGGEEIHQTNLLNDTKFETWSLNADLRLPLTSQLLLQAEGFIGRNFDSHLGGIGQGVNPTLNREIDTIGGWAALTFTPTTEWQFNLGAGADNPDDNDLTGRTDPAKDARTFNAVAFGNVFYSFNAHLQLAFELSYLRTNYKLLEAGEAWRQQFAVIYKF